MIKDLKKKKTIASKVETLASAGRRATMDAGDISAGARNRLASVAHASPDRASTIVLCVDIPGNICNLTISAF